MEQRALFQSYLYQLLIPSVPVTWKVSPGQAATLPGSAHLSLKSAASGWSCLKRSRPVLGGWQAFWTPVLADSPAYGARLTFASPFAVIGSFGFTRTPMIVHDGWCSGGAGSQIREILPKSTESWQLRICRFSSRPS